MSEVIYRQIAVGVRPLISSDHHEVAELIRDLSKRCARYLVCRPNTYDLPRKLAVHESPSYSSYMDHIFPQDSLTGALCLRGRLPNLADTRIAKTVRRNINKKTKEYAGLHFRALREKDRILSLSPQSSSVHLTFRLQRSQTRPLESVQSPQKPIDRVVLPRGRVRTYPGRFRLKTQSS